MREAGVSQKIYALAEFPDLNFLWMEVDFEVNVEKILQRKTDSRLDSDVKLIFSSFWKN